MNANLSGGDEHLAAMLQDRALCKGNFKLSSGAHTYRYWNCKRVTLASDGSSLVGQEFAKVISGMSDLPSAIGGPLVGAAPIVGAVQRFLPDLDGFYVRSTAKGHGTGCTIENQPERGTRVVLVDDVVTSGGSMIRACDAVRGAGCEIVGVIALLDRGEGGAERIQQATGHFSAIFRLPA